ncbi:hypothetical protein [Zhongshania sp.]|uniref:hypothetical protein n=1 Tax=Zhongshania sp. TaxID=1971902 RepID=UPI003568E8B2
MKIKNYLIKHSVKAVLATSAWMATKESLNPITSAFMSGIAKATIKSKGIREAKNLADLGRQWQRGFPSSKQVPIKEISADTVIAEIHTPCPLRATGDVNACYRMMQFDREVVKKAGGQFVVLSSQASPGNTFCTVAMRLRGADITDLIPAHEVKES